MRARAKGVKCVEELGRLQYVDRPPSTHNVNAMLPRIWAVVAGVVARRRLSIAFDRAGMQNQNKH